MESGTRSASGLLGIALGCPPFIVAIEVATLLDVSRVSGNDGVGHAQKSPGNDPSHLKAIEIHQLQFSQHSPHCLPDTLRFDCTNEHYLHLCGHEEKVPSRGMDLAIKRQAIERFDQSPLG